MLDPDLVRRLLTEANTYVGPHQIDPATDAWFAGRGPHGDLGPYDSADDALIALVRWAWQQVDDARQQRDMAEDDAAALRDELAAMRAAVGRIGQDLLKTAGD